MLPKQPLPPPQPSPPAMPSINNHPAVLLQASGNLFGGRVSGSAPVVLLPPHPPHHPPPHPQHLPPAGLGFSPGGPKPPPGPPPPSSMHPPPFGGVPAPPRPPQPPVGKIPPQAVLSPSPLTSSQTSRPNGSALSPHGAPPAAAGGTNAREVPLRDVVREGAGRAGALPARSAAQMRREPTAEPERSPRSTKWDVAPAGRARPPPTDKPREAEPERGRERERTSDMRGDWEWGPRSGPPGERDRAAERPSEREANVPPRVEERRDWRVGGTDAPRDRPGTDAARDRVRSRDAEQDSAGRVEPTQRDRPESRDRTHDGARDGPQRGGSRWQFVDNSSAQWPQADHSERAAGDRRGGEPSRQMMQTPPPPPQQQQQQQHASSQGSCGNTPPQGGRDNGRARDQDNAEGSQPPGSPALVDEWDESTNRRAGGNDDTDGKVWSCPFAREC